MRSHVATVVFTAIPVAIIAFFVGRWNFGNADGDPVGHRNYTNYEGVVQKVSTAKIEAIPPVCFEHSDQCKWTIDFETNPRPFDYPPMQCETDYCLQISAHMQRTEEDDQGNATSGTDLFYLQTTISAYPPPKKTSK